ncbi:MAG: tRNA dihydrouridine synthase DusB [Clostridia bacterium]|nr:tRNA dihydrouridine synthase DusB [Clostridia bacterium]MDD3862461.1 tRNA dihydrouridine synthase DusB [Clostridia bacterium]MDD4408280.1 tRNA dihydrouridine synthase DusB [Clostridia bacterium]
MKIGKIDFSSNLFLAPMAGVTDFAFRSIAREFGAGFSYTEMVSGKGLVFSKKREVYKQMLYNLPNESPVAVQLFGSEPDVIVQACRHPDIQKFDCIDINMGCPAVKIVRNGEGSALLRNLKLAEKLAKECVKAVAPKPVTVKMRIGFENNSNVSLELGRMLENVGVSAICLHARTRDQFYSGSVNYEAIANLKSKLKIPVIGNGDVVDLASYKKMLETKVDAVMIGRGALGKPWIFELLSNELKNEKTNKDKNINISIYENNNKKEIIKKHFILLEKIYSEKFIINHMRKHLLWYVKEIPYAVKLRQELCKIESKEHVFMLIDKIFAD